MLIGFVRRSPLALLVLLLGGLLLIVPLAGRAAAASALDAARSALQQDPVYVADDAEAKDLVDANQVRDAVRGSSVEVAVLPRSVTSEVGGNCASVPKALGGQHTYAVLCGTEFRAGSSVLRQGAAARLATQAFNDHRGRDRASVTAALVEFADNAKSAPTTGSSGGSDSSTGSDNGSSGGSGGLILAVLVLLGGGGTVGYLVSRRRRRARQTASDMSDARADVQGLYQRLGSDVSTLDPGPDKAARQAMADASERYTAAGGMLSTAKSLGELTAARHAVVEGLYAARSTRERLGLDPGPPVPEPDSRQAQLEREQQVDVQGQRYNGYPRYTPGAPYYYPGGMLGGGFVPGGWYGSPFWESMLVGGLAGAALGGWGFGGWGFGGGYGGYGMGYGSGYAEGYEQGNENDGGGGDWGGGGGGDWGGGGGGDFGGGGDWGGGGGGDGGGGSW